LLVVGARAKGRDLHVDSDCDQFPILESISEDRRDGLAANPGSFMSVQLQQPIARFDPFPGGLLLFVPICTCQTLTTVPLQCES
jgi:hypothetical protein